MWKGNIQGCKICSSNNKCAECDIGFALKYDYKCEKCPDKCKSCFFGGYYDNESKNWNLLMSEWD